VNSLQLLTAKPVTYLVNLSEKDYIRKKNKWLPKIKGWIDEHNPGDPLIPFSVSLEERLAPLSDADKEAEQKSIGATSGLGKITQAGYSSLEVCTCWSLILDFNTDDYVQSLSSSDTSPVDRMRFEHGLSERAPRLPRRPESFSELFSVVPVVLALISVFFPARTLRTSLYVVRS
jgi:hypothetical protein